MIFFLPHPWCPQGFVEVQSKGIISCNGFSETKFDSGWWGIFNSGVWFMWFGDSLLESWSKKRESKLKSSLFSKLKILFESIDVVEVKAESDPKRDINFAM